MDVTGYRVLLTTRLINIEKQLDINYGCHFPLTRGKASSIIFAHLSLIPFNLLMQLPL